MPSSPKIIQLIHPGAQFFKARSNDEIIWNKDHKTGKREWNYRKNKRSNHYRKFISSNNAGYLDANLKLKKGNITFFGEWEPPSNFKLINTEESFRRLVHKPIFNFKNQNTQSDKELFNTDPYVFGNNFWYTNCKQKKKHTLRNLSSNSIIIFGTEYGKKDAGFFYVDTIFIIKRRFSYSEIDYETSLISDPLRKATINLLSEEYRTKYGYYQGLMYQDNRNYFSFVPAKIQEHGKEKYHERLKLNVRDYDFKSMKYNKKFKRYHGAGTGIKEMDPFFNDKYKKSELGDTLSSEVLSSFWHRIVDECFKQGFVLGVHLPED